MTNSLKNYVITVLLSLSVPTIAYNQIQKIYLHPKAPATAKQSSFVDSIRFVPLEVREGIKLVLFSNLEVTEKYFMLIDYNSKILLLYSKDGRFVKKIIYKKLGEGFYPAYRENNNEIVFYGINRNYALTPKDMVQIRLDADNQRNKKYFRKYRINLNDTAFTIEKDSPDENDLIRAYPFYDDYYWQGGINTSPLYKDSLDYEIKIYKNKKLVKSYFPYNRINEPRFLFSEEGAQFTKTDTPYIHYATRPYCDTVYKMIRDSLVPVYQLVFPLENSLPPAFFTKRFNTKTDRENYQRNNGWMFSQIVSFYETPRLYVFTIRYFNNYESYVYQKQNNITYKTSNIKPDSSQYNLELLEGFDLQRRGGWYFKPQKAGELLEFFKENKNVPVPKELGEFLKSNPPATTPVIVEFKLKHTL